ncbi:glycosyl hydrolases family [Fusarium denticulatum]|uniref:Glycosyl hydrolases family n=1 Tax=Fusarium denticulatum TaxID=48507 RepID=A0A8H5U2S2_9HYPO|nr:glycosyl hydrolases family [Fusarium denticulatum]
MTFQIPHLRKTATGQQLVVHDRPFLILGGELQNSSMSSAKYMKRLWPWLKENSINTVLGAVSWEGIEPEEGKFDFTELDQTVLDARANGLHLILLYFGSWKNGMSSYAPGWVKKDKERFPRARIRGKGGRQQTVEVLSLFGQEAQQSDARAFAALMQHLKEIDEKHSTVIMVQVENEIGLLDDSRDFSPLADQRWQSPVPRDLVKSLLGEWDQLNEPLKNTLSVFKEKGHTVPDGTWGEVFGDNAHADQIFMAYHYALYTNQVASSGKSVYPLPMYTNGWQSCNAEERDPAFELKWAHFSQDPGHYPSGGPNVNVLDIWKMFCPSLDFISPDIYLNRHESACEQFLHRGNVLFCPEMRRDAHHARRVWTALGNTRAIGTSPFGIDTVELEFGCNPYKRTYEILSAVAGTVLDAQAKPNTTFGFYFDEPSVNNSKDDIERKVTTLGGYKFTIRRSFVFGQPRAGSGMILWLGESRFLFLGFGYSVTVASTDEAVDYTGILTFHEMEPDDSSPGGLSKVRALNGDETKGGTTIIMPNELIDFGDFNISITIPGETGIAAVELYTLLS